jgi:hypothetical protein
MNINDFRYMRQGQQLCDLNPTEAPLLNSLHQRSNKNDRALLVYMVFLLHQQSIAFLFLK